MTKNYIDNKRFEYLIIHYRGNKENLEVELFTIFDLLIENIIKSFKFNLDIDDAKQECFILILKTLKNFNKEDGSAFNYFTTIIINNLRLIYSKNKQYVEKIDAYRDSLLKKLNLPVNQR